MSITFTKLLSLSYYFTQGKDLSNSLILPVKTQFGLTAVKFK